MGFFCTFPIYSDLKSANNIYSTQLCYKNSRLLRRAHCVPNVKERSILYVFFFFISTINISTTTSIGSPYDMQISIQYQINNLVNDYNFF